jgi:hypothetical protein
MMPPRRHHAIVAAVATALFDATLRGDRDAQCLVRRGLTASPDVRVRSQGK